MKQLPLIIAVMIMSIIFYFSNIPNLHFISDPQLPVWLKMIISKTYIKIGQSGFFSYALSLHPDFLIHKMGHIVLYGLLGVSLYFATKNSMKWSLLLTVLFAVSDEFHQGYIIGRSARFGDVLLDTAAAFFFILVARRISRHKVMRTGG